MPKPFITREVSKIALYSILIVSLGVLATACSRRTTTTTSTTSSADVQIRIWRTGQSEDVLKSAISKFKAKNKSAKLTVTYDERDIENFELDSLKSLAARTGPDVWSIPNDWLGDHIPRIQPIPANYFFLSDKNGKKLTTGKSPVESIKELYPEGIAEQLIDSDGKTVLGLPTNVDSLRLYYNPDLLRAAYNEFEDLQGRGASSDITTPVKQLLNKPPATWADLLEQEKYVTKVESNTIVRSTIALGTADNVSQATNILSLLILQNGSRVVSTDRKNALFHIPTTSPSGITIKPGEQALDFYASFSNPSRVSYNWNASMPQDLDAFGQGRVAMVIAFSDFEAQLKEKYPRFKFDIAPVPQNSVTEAPVNLIKFSIETVTKTANNLAASFAFLPYFTSRESVAGIASASKLTTPYLADLEMKKDAEFINQVLTGKSVFKRSRTQFDNHMKQMIIDVSQNGLTNDKALDSGAEKINRLLQADNQL